MGMVLLRAIALSEWRSFFIMGDRFLLWGWFYHGRSRVGKGEQPFTPTGGGAMAWPWDIQSLCICEQTDLVIAFLLLS